MFAFTLHDSSFLSGIFKRSASILKSTFPDTFCSLQYIMKFLKLFKVNHNNHLNCRFDELFKRM